MAGPAAARRANQRTQPDLGPRTIGEDVPKRAGLGKTLVDRFTVGAPSLPARPRSPRSAARRHRE